MSFAIFKIDLHPWWHFIFTSWTHSKYHIPLADNVRGNFIEHHFFCTKCKKQFDVLESY